MRQNPHRLTHLVSCGWIDHNSIWWAFRRRNRRLEAAQNKHLTCDNIFIYLFYIFLYCPFSKTACIQKTYFGFLRASLSSEASSTDNKHRKLVVAHQLVATVGIHCRKHNFLQLMTNIRARESIHVLLLKGKQIHNDLLLLLLLLHFMLKPYMQNLTSAMNCT